MCNVGTGSIDPFFTDVQILAGSMLVTGGYDTQVSLWDMENMVQQLRLQVMFHFVRIQDQGLCIPDIKSKFEIKVPTSSSI